MREPEGVIDVTTLLRRAGSAMAEACRDGAVLGTDARRALLAEIDRAEAVLVGARAALLLAERESGAWRGSGDPSFAAWRGRTTRGGVRAGAADERRAEALATVPTMAQAAASGEITVAHVDVVGRTVGLASPAVREALGAADGQDRVLQMASRLDAGRFATAMARYAAAIDAGQLERGHRAQRAARYLHLVDASDGTRITGRLDHMAGHRLRLALEALSPRPAADDDRDPAQRRADALEAMADRLLGLPDVVPGAAVRPHVSFLMTDETWAALRATRRDGDVDARADTHAGPVAPATLEDGTPVPPSEVARALCDCELTRIVLDAASTPVDLGRTARTYTGAQRRAVLARDGGCVWEGCGLAPRWLEVHHARWWDPGPRRHVRRQRRGDLRLPPRRGASPEPDDPPPGARRRGGRGDVAAGQVRAHDAGWRGGSGETACRCRRGATWGRNGAAGRRRTATARARRPGRPDE